MLRFLTAAATVVALLTLSVPVPAAPKTSVQLVDAVRNSLVYVTTESVSPEGVPQTSYCAGFVVQVPNLVLTAEHCAKQNTTVDGMPVEIVQQNAKFALLRTQVIKPALPLAKGNAPIGTEAIAVGFGGDMFMALSGIISTRYRDDFSLDRPFIGGMSGGPIVNEMGEVIGLTQATNDFMGIACGVDEIRQFLNWR